MTCLDRTRPLDDGFIDRIVDGELTPAELRAAIDRLDIEQDGWKRCALAFLEAQCWRETLQTADDLASSAIAGRWSSVTSTVPAGKSLRHWIRGPIAAAIVAASFAIGWVGHSALPSSGGGRTSVSPPIATAPDRPDSDHRSLEGQAPAGPRLAGFPSVNELVRAVGRLRVGSQSGGAEVPILAGPGINEQWLRNQPPALTEHAQVALQRHGYRVDQSRRLVTTMLPDGRRVSLPIDQVQISFTGNNPL